MSDKQGATKMLNRMRNGSNVSYFAQFVYALLAVLCLSPLAGATSYFVDCSGGKHGNPGTSQSTAGKTLRPGKPQPFAPRRPITFIPRCTLAGNCHPGGRGPFWKPTH